ncbi:MAG: carboxypeptidase-like regulatory domain-containing protein [Bacteroidota bacterium]|nr:carboxypeptidase-like regulatory domain-containing protein [Bacteroidota bacterium]
MKKLLFFIIPVFSILLFSFTVPYHQLFNTTLQVTVRDELGNVVEGAEVVLYKSESDYEQNANAAIEPLTTNVKGVVTIKKLEPIEYYVNVSKGDANNFGAGVQTGVLEAKKMNKVTIIIE